VEGGTYLGSCYRSQGSIGALRRRTILMYTSHWRTRM
jgi:hypothetical protein